MIRTALLLTLLAVEPEQPGSQAAEWLKQGVLGSVIVALVVDRFRTEGRHDKAIEKLEKAIEKERDLNSKLTDSLRDVSIKSTEVNVGVRDELHRLADEVRDGD